MRHSIVDQPEFGPETDALPARVAAGYEPPSSSVAAADLYLPVRGGPVPVRVYRTPGAEPRPLLLWLHGGGFIGGSVADLDYPCSRIAAAAGVTLVSLGYRLAPAHPFPAALHDTVDAIGWLRRHGEVLGSLGGDGRLVAGGQSAGANLVDGGRSAPVIARRWPLCHPCAGAACRQIDHRLSVDGDGGRSAPRFERVNRSGGPRSRIVVAPSTSRDNDGPVGATAQKSTELGRHYGLFCVVAAHCERILDPPAAGTWGTLADRPPSGRGWRWRPRTRRMGSFMNRPVRVIPRLAGRLAGQVP
jgi:hypothetical protein